MMIRSLLGCAAIIAGTSCTPVPRDVRKITAVHPIKQEEAELLRRLALIPPDPADTASPPIAAPAIVTPLTGAPAFTPAMRSQDDADRAVQCLAAAVYYESRSEPLDGQRAVAQVVLNRVRDRAFPSSVCGVVYQRTATVCQFSFACDGSMSRPRDPSAWVRARAIAQAAFDGEVYAPIGASTHFHTTAISPWWAPSLARIGTIGAHVFYGWRRAMAGALNFRRTYAGIEPGAGPLPTLIADAQDTVEGVVVHRGSAAPPADSASPARLIFASGVHIHRGALRPVNEASHGATIGPEELPDMPADSI